MNTQEVYAFSSPLPPPCSQSDVLKVYDAWIAHLLKRHEKDSVSLSLFFENDRLAQTWRSLDDKPEYLKDIHAPDIESVKDSPAELRDINLFRHKKLKWFLDQHRDTDLYYQACSYGDAFFAYLCSVSYDHTSPRNIFPGEVSLAADHRNGAVSDRHC